LSSSACPSDCHFAVPVRNDTTICPVTLLASGIAASQADVVEQVTGPSVSVAYKDGQPTPAAHAFAKKSGVEVAQLERVNTPKGEYIAAKVTKKGRSAAEILAEGLPKELSSIYWPKNMYWQKPNERFVRPVRWLGRCSMGIRFRWSSTGFERGRIRAATASCQTVR